MGVEARLNPPSIDVEPGRTATVTLAVRNTGTARGQFTVELARGTVPWITLPATTLTLLPYEEGVAVITAAPPRSWDVPAGPTDFDVRVLPVDGSGVEEPDAPETVHGSVVVGSYTDVSVELTPRTLTGRTAGRAQLTVTNQSNATYRGDVSGRDPDLALALRFTPTSVRVGPGDTATVEVVVRPRRRIVRGVPVTLPFTVAVSPSASEERDFFGDLAPTPGGRVGEGTAAFAEELTASGTMVQAPLAPGRVGPVAAAVAVIVVLAVLGWFAVVRPEIRDTVRSEVGRQLAASGVTASPTGRSTATGTGRSGVSVAGGLTVNGSLLAAGNGTQSYTVPTGKELQITDILVQNPAGDSGVVALARSNTILMQWSMANFRDLDYHWVTPIVLGPGSALQLQTSGCVDTCTPGLYYAGTLIPAGS